MREIICTGFRSLLSGKIRSLLTITGIAVGVMSVVIISSIGELGKLSINNELSGMGMDSLVVSAQSGAVNKLTEKELEKIKSLNMVKNAMPLMSIITEGTIKGTKVTCMAWGVNEDADNVIDLEVIHGRLINRGDIAEKKNVCVIDESIAVEQYKRSNVIGKNITITIGTTPINFEIIGVVKNGVNTIQSMLGGFIPDFIYIPYSVMQTNLGKNTFDQITVKLNDNSQSKLAAEDVKNALSYENNPNDYSVDNLLSQKEKMSNILSIATIALSAVAGISLIVSGISIMTVMLVSVNERTREIGIKKSIGANCITILIEFLAESELISLIGSLFGILLGISVSCVIFIATGGPFLISWKLCGIIMLISMLIGGVFGVYPAFKASSLNPVDALRHE
ncbi:MAG: ABC transporter permease [Oscillospiraceae bacterium]